jgi:hypothetical protein
MWNLYNVTTIDCPPFQSQSMNHAMRGRRDLTSLDRTDCRQARLFEHHDI